MSDVVPGPLLRAAADRILELHEAGQIEAALEACDALDREAARADPTDPVVRESWFTARFERGVLYAELGDLDAAAAAYLDASRLPFDLDEPDEAHELAMALLNAGIGLEQTGDRDAALRTYDELLVRLEGATDPVTSEQVLRARVNRAVALLGLERPAEALTDAEVLAARLDAADPLEAEQLGMIQRVRAAALRALDRVEEAVMALAAAEAVAAVEEGGARSQAAAAQGERAALLAELGRADEAIALLEETAARFGDDPEVGEVVDGLLQAEADLLDATGQHDRAAEVRARAD